MNLIQFSRRKHQRSRIQLTATVRDADGTLYIVSNHVRDADGTLYAVADKVRDADGVLYPIFA